MHAESILLASLEGRATGLAALEVPLDPTLLPAGVLLITGLFMLLAGRRLLKPGLGIIGALIGCLTGNALGLAFSTALPPVTWAFLGGLVGLAFGLLMWRMTVATLMAGSCSAGAVLAILLALNSGMINLAPPSNAGSLATLNVQPTGARVESSTEAETFETAMANAAGEHALGQFEEKLSTVRERADNWLGTLNNELRLSLGGFTTDWNALDGRLKSALAGVAALGGLFGFLFGLAAWKQSSAIVTVVAGAGLVLMGCLISYQSFSSGSTTPLSEFNPGIWLGVWIGLAVTGGIIQWQIERRSADRELEEEF